MSDASTTGQDRCTIDNFFSAQRKMMQLMRTSCFNVAFEDFRTNPWAIEQVTAHEWTLHAEGLQGYPDLEIDGISAWDQTTMHNLEVTSCDGYSLVVFLSHQSWCCWVFSDKNRVAVEVAQAEYAEDMRMIEELQNADEDE